MNHPSAIQNPTNDAPRDARIADRTTHESLVDVLVARRSSLVTRAYVALCRRSNHRATADLDIFSLAQRAVDVVKTLTRFSFLISPHVFALYIRYKPSSRFLRTYSLHGRQRKQQRATVDVVVRVRRTRVGGCVEGCIERRGRVGWMR